MNIILNIKGKCKCSHLPYMESFTAKSGNILEFEFVVENKNETSLDEIIVRLPLPKSLVFINTIRVECGDVFYSSLTDSILWTIPYISKESSYILKLSVIVMRGLDHRDSAALCGFIQEYAEVSNRLIFKGYIKSNDMNIYFINQPNALKVSAEKEICLS